MPRRLKKKIRLLSKKMKKSLSETAVHIIEKSLNFFKKIHFTEEETPEFSKYRNIYWKSHLHIYFDELTYRKIKHIGDTHMAFSIAIIIRWLFNYYFKNLYNKKKKKENKAEIEKINNEVENFEFFTKIWGKNIPNKQLSGKFYYQLTFNDKFSVTGFNFLPTG